MLTSPTSKTRAITVVEYLQRGIQERIFEAGHALPPERELAVSIGVSRATLREGISVLAAKGLLIRRHGDGTYVSATMDQRMAEIWSDMVERHPLIQADLIEFREMLESRAAELAAERRTESDKLRLAQLCDEVDVAYRSGDRGQQVRTDVALHRAIAEAAYNPVFSYLIASLLKLLHEHVQLSIAGLSPQSDTALQLRTQHREIVAAILAGDSARARTASARHIDFVRTHLNDMDRAPLRQKR